VTKELSVSDTGSADQTDPNTSDQSKTSSEQSPGLATQALDSFLVRLLHGEKLQVLDEYIRILHKSRSEAWDLYQAATDRVQVLRKLNTALNEENEKLNRENQKLHADLISSLENNMQLLSALKAYNTLFEAIKMRT
jgi:hypothetical protein